MMAKPAIRPEALDDGISLPGTVQERSKTWTGHADGFP